MNKITFGFFRTKRNKAIQGMLVLFALFLCNTSSSWGQTPVSMSSQVGLTYTENFADIVNWTANFASGIGSSRWASYPITTGGTANDGKRTTKSSAIFATLTTGGIQKGTGNLVFLSTGSTATSEAVAVDLLLDFTGVLAGTLSFNWGTIDNSNGTRPTSLRVYWSTDNATFTEITAAQIIDVQSTSSGSISNVILPVNFNNSATARLRFYNHAGKTTSGSGARDKISIDDLVVTANAITSTTWNGSTWLNGNPSATVEAIIDGDYSTTTNGAFVTKKLTVNSGKSLTVNAGTNVTVQNEVVNNGTLVVENNANLIQVNPASVNTGNVTVKRNSNALSRLDYTIWSSPVANQNLLAFSPNTTTTRFYNYDTTTGFYSTILDPSTTNFTVGLGNLIRMPNNAVDAPATETFSGQFTGVLNNGNIPVILAYADASHPYNMVGNPYSSAISAETFLSANAATIESTLYFWRKTNGAGGSAYATYTAGGGTTTTATSATPNGTIQVGQGFFVAAKAAGVVPVLFTNAMREASPTSTQFFKTKAEAQKDRIWLNLTNADGAFSQALVAYIADAASGVDRYDGKYINDSPVALTSSINNEEYVIQGRPAFDATDVVTLNFKTDVSGTYTIAKDHADGLFANGQDVYLVDSKTGAETNLQTAAYTFTAAAGADNSRFKLTYKTSGALKVNSQTFNENSIYVYKQNGLLSINAGTTILKNVKVFDMTGKLLAEQKSVNATTTSMKNLNIGKQSVLVQVTSEDNKVVTKKAIY